MTCLNTFACGQKLRGFLACLLKRPPPRTSNALDSGSGGGPLENQILRVVRHGAHLGSICTTNTIG